MKLRWPWSREPSLVDRLFDWLETTQKTLDDYDPQGAVEFRDHTRAWLESHRDPPPSREETWWFIERGMRIVRASHDRLDAAP
jgi:hypothetical protein